MGVSISGGSVSMIGDHPIPIYVSSVGATSGVIEPLTTASVP